MGVFATRSPFRPNPIGLSSVRLEKIEWQTDAGPVLHVTGADLMDGTPILDIKPYIAYSDCHMDATGGFTNNVANSRLEVMIPSEWLQMISPSKQQALREVLANDPRPPYQDDSNRIYGLAFAGLNVRFTVSDNVLTVVEVVEL